VPEDQIRPLTPVLRKIVIKSDERRLVFGEVYSPLHVDTDKEAMTKAEIEAMAHRFLISGRVNKIDVGHDRVESGCLVAESFVARKNDPDGFIEGAWVMGVYVLPDDLWDAVKKGELNGFSFSGSAERVPTEVVVEMTRKIEGETEKSVDDEMIPPHSHPLMLSFSDNGRVAPGQFTEEAMGHRHPVERATATEKELGHSHRLVIIENK
jgi:hypothetical protein